VVKETNGFNCSWRSSVDLDKHPQLGSIMSLVKAGDNDYDLAMAWKYNPTRALAIIAEVRHLLSAHKRLQETGLKEMVDELNSNTGNISSIAGHLLQLVRKSWRGDLKIIQRLIECRKDHPISDVIHENLGMDTETLNKFHMEQKDGKLYWPTNQDAIMAELESLCAQEDDEDGDDDQDCDGTSNGQNSDGTGNEWVSNGERRQWLL
jgi:hypothetical protein